MNWGIELIVMDTLRMYFTRLNVMNIVKIVAHRSPRLEYHVGVLKCGVRNAGRNINEINTINSKRYL